MNFGGKTSVPPSRSGFHTRGRMAMFIHRYGTPTVREGRVLLFFVREFLDHFAELRRLCEKPLGAGRLRVEQFRD